MYKPDAIVFDMDGVLELEAKQYQMLVKSLN